MCPSHILRRGGGQLTRSVLDISEWIKIDGQRRKGHVSLLVTFYMGTGLSVPLIFDKFK